MFAKKLLNTVCLLFLGSQLISKAGASALTACTGIDDYTTELCSDSTGSGKYCIHSDNKIYEYETGTGCAIPVTPVTAGIYAFEDANDGAGGVRVFNAGEDDTAVGILNNVSLYRCTSDANDVVTCAQTYGYFNYGTNTYTVNKSGTNAVAVTAEIEGQCTTAPGDIGLLFKDGTDVKLCLDGTEKTQKIDTADTITTYFMINKAGNVFTTGASDNDKYLVIEASKNAITYVSNDYDYCVKANEVANETFKEFCEAGSTDANPCGTNEISECTSGLCTREEHDDSCKMKADGTTNGNCESAGYYILNIGDGDSAGDGSGFYNLVKASDGADKVGSLYNCSTSSAESCNLVSSTGFQQGYYPNAASEDENDVPYIKCTSNNACNTVSVASDCTNAGDITFSSVYKICLEAGAAVTPIDINTTATRQNHFVSLANGSIFGVQNTNRYVEIDVANGNVLLTTPGTKAASQKYIYTDDDYKVHLKADNTAICTANAVIVEFKLDASGSTDNELIVYEKQAEYKIPNN